MNHYPDLKSDEEVRKFIVERDIQRRIVDGVEMYFGELEHNLFTRDLDLVMRKPEWSANNALLVKYLLSEYGPRQTPLRTSNQASAPISTLRTISSNIQCVPKGRCCPKRVR